MTKSKLQKILLLIMLLIITAVVYIMFKPYLMVMLLSAITAGLVSAPYKALLVKFKGKESLSSLITVLFIVIGALLPLMLIIGLFTSQAISVSHKITPFVQEQISSTNSINDILEKLPMSETLIKYRVEIIDKIGTVAQKISSILVSKLSKVTFSALNFILLTFLYLYTLFFFIKDGKRFLDKALYYLPFENDFEKHLIDRLTSISRATLKGTLLIGLIQGVIAGIALWIAGISSPIFWTVIMIFLSVIPLIGTPLVWVPAGIFLIVTGNLFAGIALIAFCGIVVSNVDNILRPIFIGQDTKLHELLVLFSTLGGISIFGIVGFIIGPIFVGLWVTLWEFYGEAFSEFLPEVDVVNEKVVEEREDILEGNENTNFDESEE